MNTLCACTENHGRIQIPYMAHSPLRKYYLFVILYASILHANTQSKQKQQKITTTTTIKLYMPKALSVHYAFNRLKKKLIAHWSLVFFITLPETDTIID